MTILVHGSRKRRTEYGTLNTTISAIYFRVTYAWSSFQLKVRMKFIIASIDDK